MRKSDAAAIAAGKPGRVLMKRAAQGVFDAVKWKSPVAIVFGGGNNAGDGYALALLLHESGTKCSLIRTSGKFSEDGKYYYDLCVSSAERASGIEFLEWYEGGSDIDLSGYGTIVDCLLGTGFKGEVRSHLSHVIECINSSEAFVVSVDINSGLNGDTGLADTCVRSDLTVSVGGFKPGHFLNTAKDVIASKINVDIGISPVDPPYKLIEEPDVREILGTRANHSNKGTYGYTALIGGCTRYSGAIRLAYLANAAMRSGAGVVKVALPSALVRDVAPHILESTMFPLSYMIKSYPTGSYSPLTDKRTETYGADECEDLEVAYVKEQIDELISNVRTVAFGMGIGTGEGAQKILIHLLTKYSGTLIIDADGLSILAKLDRSMVRNSTCNTILTPHLKEFSRLTKLEISEINNDPIGHAKDYAKDTNCVVLLKGPSTIVTDGTDVLLTDRGCPGMATAGSGDVLSGVMSAVCGAKSVAEEKNNKILMIRSVAATAFINGAAGELAEKKYGSISMIASDTISMLPYVFTGTIP
ncbi:MAG: NAD(P)H-hydrate dehydratase [Lachnospiraceae bacterium]|nr:NAD(P)H-hydrate dehydratase [Lachnospiraceae bacterium]